DEREGGRLLWLAVFLFRADRRSAKKRPETRSRRQGDQTGLRARLAHSGTRLGFLQRQSLSATLPGRRIHRHARLMEPIQDGRLQSRLRSVCQWQTRRPHRRCSHRIHRRRVKVRSLRAPRRSYRGVGRLASGRRRQRRQGLADHRKEMKINLAAKACPEKSKEHTERIKKTMKNLPFLFATLAFFAASFFLVALSSLFAAEPANPHIVETGPSEKLILPLPNATRAVANPPTIIPWPKGKTPIAPAGFDVTLLADDLDNPRMIQALPNGDVLGMESLRQQSTSRVILLRDTEKSGKPNLRRVFVRRLNLAFGMALIGNRLYIGNTDSVVV